jgi:hypothetical protein
MVPLYNSVSFVTYNASRKLLEQVHCYCALILALTGALHRFQNGISSSSPVSTLSRFGHLFKHDNLFVPSCCVRYPIRGALFCLAAGRLLVWRPLSLPTRSISCAREWPCNASQRCHHHDCPCTALALKSLSSCTQLYRTMREGVRQVLDQQGPRGLYVGMWPTLVSGLLLAACIDLC